MTVIPLSMIVCDSSVDDLRVAMHICLPSHAGRDTAIGTLLASKKARHNRYEANEPERGKKGRNSQGKRRAVY